MKPGDWFLLSPFDGVGCAHLAPRTVVPNDAQIVHIAWETDAGCLRLTTQKLQTYHRGDLLQDKMDDFMAFIDQKDPNEVVFVMICAGPPCPDFSRIVQSPGRSGAEGQKFDRFIEWQKDLRPPPTKEIRETGRERGPTSQERCGTLCQ